MKHNSTFLFISVVVLSVLAHTCIGEPCPGDHKCTGMGYMIVDEVTGEAGFCVAPNTVPLCAGVDINGTKLATTTPNPEETTTTTTPTTTIIIPTTTTTTTPSCEVASCVNKVAGVYAYPECKCEKYYTCNNPASGSGGLILRQYSCTGGQVFDISTLSCVTNTLVCPHAYA
ncbi:hypothetical protein OTU49_003787 [Cherax quadricarinatus]|uniref:Chitin-binding type-2 domain-containing protein n=1 Tax=Cherax quadricarinatus TaxID=27406 RepID=A0AAW0X3S3_CHEQU